MKKETKRSIKDLAYYSSLGLQVALSIFIGFYLGTWLDKKFDTDPVLTYVFLGFGIAAGFRNIHYAMKKVMRNDVKED